ncbi:MAG: aminodeoxyfutalosine synthase [Kiritimatiellia bacterium]
MSPSTALQAPNLSPLVRRSIDLAGLGSIADKVLAGERLDYEDGLRLFEGQHVQAAGALANLVRERRHGDLTYFNRNLHINATNVCEMDCVFCSFARIQTGDPNAYTMTLDQAVGRITALDQQFVTEVHIVNGNNPDLPFDYYTDLMRAIKKARPDIHIKGFTAVEIDYYANKYGMTHREVLSAFIDAGLGSMPGGGAEIFHPRARRKLCDDKVDADGWLQVHRVAHGMGLRTNATMLFGSIETLGERVDHMMRLRQLQDETGGFQTFIPLKFHATNNRLARLPEPTGHDCLLTLAVGRLMLDNFDHIKAYWPMLSVETAQLSLAYGVDDLDGTVREERIYHMAGAETPQGLSRVELIDLIVRAGRIPVERDTLYRVVAPVEHQVGV